MKLKPIIIIIIIIITFTTTTIIYYTIGSSTYISIQSAVRGSHTESHKLKTLKKTYKTHEKRKITCKNTNYSVNILFQLKCRQNAFFNVKLL